MSNFQQMRSNAIGIANSQGIGALRKAIDSAQKTSDSINNNVKRLVTLHQQLLDENLKQTALLEQILERGKLSQRLTNPTR